MTEQEQVEKVKGKIIDFLAGRHHLGIESATEDADDLFAYVPELAIISEDQGLPPASLPGSIIDSYVWEGQQDMLSAGFKRVIKVGE